MGKEYGLWEGGQMVFMTCIFIANLVLLKMHNNYTGWGELLIFMSMASYIVVLSIEM